MEATCGLGRYNTPERLDINEWDVHSFTWALKWGLLDDMRSIVEEFDYDPWYTFRHCGDAAFQRLGVRLSRQNAWPIAMYLGERCGNVYVNRLIAVILRLTTEQDFTLI